MLHALRLTFAAMLGAWGLLALPGAGATAQPERASARGDTVVRPVPFGPGERLQYEVRVGGFGEVGHGFMEVAGLVDVRGSSAYHLRFGVTASALLGTLKVDNLFQSWLDVSSLSALRFQQNQKEPRYARHRQYEFFTDRAEWVSTDYLRSGHRHVEAMLTKQPLDDVSMIYFVRTLPLEVGRTYTLDRYFKEDGNPVEVKVLRKETVTVPAGTFNTIVVQPIIKTDGLFGDGGRAEVYFSDDDRRLIVLLKSRMPVLRSLDLRLTRVTPGVQMSPMGL